MTLTPGQYLQKRREAAGLSIDDVAERITTEPRWAEHLRRGWLELIESDQMPATIRTIAILHQVVRFDLDVLVAISVAGRAVPRLCSSCACSEADPCVGLAGSCSWVAAELCSACFDRAPSDRLNAISPAAADHDVAA